MRRGELPVLALQQEMMMREGERRSWLLERKHQAEDVLDFLVDHMKTKRDISDRERGWLEAEVQGLLLGLKKSLLINSTSVPLENVLGLEQKLKEIDEQLVVVGDFILDSSRINEFLLKHRALAKDAGWEDLEKQKERIRSLSEIMRTQKPMDMLAQDHLAIGTLLGYPEEAVRGFASEIAVRQASGAPAPETLDMPEAEKQQTYIDEFGLDPADAEHLASKQRRELYLNNMQEPALQAATYGGDQKDWDELDWLAKDINRYI